MFPFMCLAFPGRVLEKSGERGNVDFGGVRREVNLSLIPDSKVGDYVVVHAGFAIQLLDKEEAEETLKLWQEVSESG